MELINCKITVLPEILSEYVPSIVEFVHNNAFEKFRKDNPSYRIKYEDFILTLIRQVIKILKKSLAILMK